MDKQILISVGREFGSGGREIGHEIAQQLGIEFYDRNILSRMFGEEVAGRLEGYEEKKERILFTRSVRGHSDSIEDALAQREFDFIKEKAEEGESFVIVGRCGDSVLKGFKGHVSIFVLGDMPNKIRSVMDHRQLSERAARKEIARIDRVREKFHNKYSDTKWGDARGYDICINSSRLGLSATAEVLVDFIKRRLEIL